MTTSSLVARCALLMLPLLLPFAAHAQEEGRNPLSILGDARVTLVYDRYLVVTGIGEVVAQPDEVLFALSIQTQHTNIDTALAQNEEKLRKFSALASELGIVPADIQKEPLLVVPDEVQRNDDGVGFTTRGAFGGESKEMKRYFCRRNLTLKLRKVNMVTDFLVRLYKIDLQLVAAPLFRVSDEEKYREQARMEAIRNASTKAGTMTAAIGHKGFATQSLDNWEEWNSAESGEQSGSYRRGSYDEASAYRSGDPRIAAGTVVFRASVRALCELK